MQITLPASEKNLTYYHFRTQSKLKIPQDDPSLLKSTHFPNKFVLTADAVINLLKTREQD